MKYGLWTVLEVGREKHLCRCDCGTTRLVNRHNLARGMSASCGCTAAARNRINGSKTLVHGAKGTKEYKAWRSMRQRCLLPNAPSWENYGGRGISVCDRWITGEDGKNPFVCFLEDVGLAPSSSHSLDRIDNEGNYCPENCRWADQKTQGRNRRTNLVIHAFGKKYTLVEASETFGIQPDTIACRIKRLGWPAERALTEPSRVCRPAVTTR